jgi:MGT family glycosyltransferase
VRAAAQQGARHARVAIGLMGFEAIVLSDVRSVLDGWQSGLTDRIDASPYLTRFPASLEDPQIAGPAVTYRFRDPATDAASKELPDWWSGDQSPLVYVTLGSVIGEKSFAVAVFRAVLDGVAGIPACVLLTVGNEVDLDALGPPPPNVHVLRWVPQVDVHAHADTVVCHGGSGTVLGALGAGLPLVVVPLFADGPFNARRVAAVGAGIAVEPDTDRPSSLLGSSIDPIALREAVEAVLADAIYQRAARKLADEMNALRPTDAVLSTLAEAGLIQNAVGDARP